MFVSALHVCDRDDGQAMNELNETVKEVEEKREKIWNDVQWHCAQSYFILLQALTMSIKEKGEFYEKGVVNSTQLKPALEAAQKVQVRDDTTSHVAVLMMMLMFSFPRLQPDKALQVKAEDLAVLYSDADEPCTFPLQLRCPCFARDG
jgi:hypothetical protein